MQQSVDPAKVDVIGKGGVAEDDPLELEDVHLGQHLVAGAFRVEVRRELRDFPAEVSAQ
jgi:hypothetical protein